VRQVELNPKVEHLSEINTLYGLFDLDINTGRPTEVWERRNLFSLRLPFELQSAYFPGFWLKRVQVNRRASEALAKVFAEIDETFSPEARRAHGLDQFLRCYAFGSGKEPNLFWYGAGWELSPQVNGEALSKAVQIFQRHGWTYCWIRDKHRIREFEYF
jgi:hypothetical protein